MPKMLTYRNESDMPFLPVSLGDMQWSKTGSWRSMRPQYDDKTPPCNQACPAGIDIVHFLMLIEKGKFKDAWLKIKEENPFPGVCGRVCPHPCETHCNRGEYDQPVSINALERVVADATTRARSRHLDRCEQKAEKVAIVGSGPAGLSCAYHLARLGYRSDVLEALPVPGGILRTGIPAYRLPVDILNREIHDIEALGVRILTNTQVDKLFLDKHGSEYQAIFIATGAHKSQSLSIRGEEGQDVLAGLSFLHGIAMEEKIRPGKRVAIIGGGNTALDAARSALRVGSQPLIVYRRSENEMPAFQAEIDEALEEGVTMEFLTQPVKVIRENGRVAGLECVRMRLGDADASGRKRPIPVEHSNFSLEVDGILVAIGETSNAGFVEDWGGLTMEDIPGWESKGVFFGGDLVSPFRTVSHAIGSGKKGAIAIDAYLRKEPPSGVLEAIEIGETGGVSMRKYLDPDYRKLNRHVVTFDELNTAYFEPMQRVDRDRAPVVSRIRDFREVNKGLRRDQARREAERCFNCGTCNECENCYVFCPDASILKGMKKLKHDINYDYCKGCGICFVECPRNAISLVEEEK